MRWAAVVVMVLWGRGSFPQPDHNPLGLPQQVATNAPSKSQQKPVGETEKIPDPFFRVSRTFPNGKNKIEKIAVDEYIAQVLAGEGQPRAGEAAQEALAITARTFAMANRNRHRSEGFDLCDTTHCQVLRPATAITTRAAAATSGRVLLHQGQPAFVFYSALCGGRTELASQVWPGAIDYASAPSLEDDACEDEPEWTSALRAADIERALRVAGLTGSRLRSIRVVSRNASERATRVQVDGFTPSEISGHDFRMAVLRVAGPQSLKSTAFDVDRSGSLYQFRGRGYGHGVGLCVIGAGKRAARGASADDILRFYFPGLTIGLASTPAVVLTAAAKVPAAPNITLALPPAEERERASITRLLQQSVNEIAKHTGLKPPVVRVTVHPTLDSFGRATGQPWWVSGATSGAAIDLLPIAMLRQQGQLDRAIRHELTHAFVDAPLAEKPAWVREGAAAYFANPRARGDKPARVPCPSDAELLRPVSAGAHRDAYARAETCFARAIADGKRWDEIR